MKGTQLFQNTSSLQQIEADCWSFLVRAVSDAKSDFKIPVLGTTSSTGPSQRIVVLRNVQAGSGTLLIHTDSRSAKIQQLREQPNASLLFYDKPRKIQLRATVAASIHTDDSVADELWKSESATSLKGYLGPLAPGTYCAEAEHNLLPEFVNSIPDRAQLEAARPNFAAVKFLVTQFDWLQLNRSGHLQAQFRYNETRGVSAAWTAP